jgi:hypothetical protein
MRRLTIVVALLALSACRTSKTITGTIVDYDTRQPIAGATIRISQTGWGRSNGSVVWDKTFDTTAASDSAGAFVATYSVGSSAHLSAWADGFSEFEQWYEPGAHVAIRLKRREPGYTPLPSGVAQVGVSGAGAPMGWIFASRATTTSVTDADVIPSGPIGDITKALTLSAPGAGGLRFVSARDLGVDGEPMIYSGDAPASGYVSSIALDFSGPGGVMFVRTHDGAHYAKIAFTPNGLGSMSNPDGVRALLLPYVYNPSGDRRLPVERPHLGSSR